jgi:hypothetical protein
LNLAQLCVQVDAMGCGPSTPNPQVEGRERYPTAGDWPSNVGVQGVKGDKLLAESGDASSKWLRSGFSTKARKRRELEPAKRLTPVTAGTGRPKREMSPFGHVVARYVVSTRYEGHGVQCRPKVTENGCTERGNPPTALSAMGAGGQAVCPGGRDAPRSKGLG